MMWPFKRKEGERTLGDMIAYSITNPATRGDWMNNGRILANTKLSIAVESDIFGEAASASRIGGEAIPLQYDDRRKLQRALAKWREWRDAARLSDEMVEFVDRFERAYGNNARPSNVVPLHERKGA